MNLFTDADLTWFLVKYFKIDQIKSIISLNLWVNIFSSWIIFKDQKKCARGCVHACICVCACVCVGFRYADVRRAVYYSFFLFSSIFFEKLNNYRKVWKVIWDTLILLPQIIDYVLLFWFKWKILVS